MDKKLKQMVEDFDKVLNLFKKMESSSIEDIEDLKEELGSLQKDLKKRYEKPNTDENEEGVGP